MRKIILILPGIFLFSTVLTAQTGYERTKLVQFYQSQDYGKAVEYILASSAGVTDHVQLYSDLGYSYFMNEQYDDALDAFMLVYHKQPSHTLASLYIAQIYTDRKEPDSALFYYRNLIFYQPGNYRFYQKAALVFSWKSEYDSALYYFQKGYDINPRSASLVVQFSDLLIRQRNLVKADSLLQRFLAFNSSNTDVIAKKIDVSYRKPDHQAVISWGERLWGDSVDMVLPYINLAYSYLAADSLDKCIRLIDWMEIKKKTTQSLTYCAAQAYARKKEYARSNELLDECLKQSLQEDAVGYFNAKSDNYEAMKQYQKAISYYDTSYYIFKSPLDLYYIGRIYDKYLHNKEKAGYYYRKFIGKRKTPRSSGEQRVFEYIKEYFGRKN